MKCPCGNTLFADQTGGDGRCTRCHIKEWFWYYCVPKSDTDRLEQTQVDKQTLAERSNYAR
jgi:hypothetical protein